MSFFYILHTQSLSYAIWPDCHFQTADPDSLNLPENGNTVISRPCNFTNVALVWPGLPGPPGLPLPVDNYRPPSLLVQVVSPINLDLT